LNSDKLKIEFDSFVKDFINPIWIDEIVNSDQEKKLALNYIQTSITEAYLSLELINHYVEKNIKILEVGSGLGIASGFLKKQGYDVTTLDPVGLGFDQWTKLAQRMRVDFNLAHQHLAINAENLDPAIHGYFDLIFSNNVLEHVLDIKATITKLNNSLNLHGVMVHNCPNYYFPYEPHFGIPLLPFFPKMTASVIPKKISESALWKSINFITVIDIRNLAKKLDSELSFKTGTILYSLSRMEADKNFRDRHPIISRFAPLIKIKAFHSIFKKIPVILSTPMIFIWERNK
jgi:2-polyprenyl-3-methyl-5-hydroxy-6-metoxy-1,4-benzoquinol methylase